MQAQAIVEDGLNLTYHDPQDRCDTLSAITLDRDGHEYSSISILLGNA